MPRLAAQPMASIGQSKQTVQARAKQLKDGNAFLNYIETASEDGELATRWGTVWEEVSEEELGQRDIWAHLATYFVEVHRIEEGVKNAGELLDINTAQVDRLINQARNALEHSIRMRRQRCDVPDRVARAHARALHTGQLQHQPAAVLLHTPPAACTEPACYASSSCNRSLCLQRALSLSVVH